MKIKVAINGAGRIGRAFLRGAIDNSLIDIVAINDLADIENIAYLMRYDSAYGKWSKSVKVDQNKKNLIIDGKFITYLSEK